MNVFVTGTSSGIGLAVAVKFLHEGHTVFGFDTAEGRIDHEKYHHCIFDIRDGEWPLLPAPEIVINNAGTLDEKEAIDVNLRGTIRFTERFQDSPALRSVLFIASVQES